MTKPTIDSREFALLLADFKLCDENKMGKKIKTLFDYIDGKLAEAYEQGKKDATTWQPIEAATRPMPVVYLVMNNKGQVAPSIDGVIHNTIGTAWDWAYGELITHFMLMPLPKEPT